MTQEKELSFNVLVEKGGLLDIRLTVDGPAGIEYDKVLFFNRDEETNEEQGTFVLKTKAIGIHEICLDNLLSQWTSKLCRYIVYSGVSIMSYVCVTKCKLLNENCKRNLATFN